MASANESAFIAYREAYKAYDEAKSAAKAGVGGPKQDELDRALQEAYTAYLEALKAIDAIGGGLRQRPGH